MIRRVIEDDSNETSAALLQGLDYQLFREEYLRRKSEKEREAPQQQQQDQNQRPLLASRTRNLQSQRRNRLAPLPGAALARVREYIRENHGNDDPSPSTAFPPVHQKEEVEWESRPQRATAGSPTSRRPSPLGTLLQLATPTPALDPEGNVVPRLEVLSLVSKCSEADKDAFNSAVLVPEETRPIPTPTRLARTMPLVSQIEQQRREAQKVMWKRITYGISSTGVPPQRAIEASLSPKSRRRKKDRSPSSRSPMRRPSMMFLSTGGFSPEPLNENASLERRLSTRRRATDAFWESTLSRLPSKHDVVIALNKAKSHFASVPLRKTSRLQRLRPSIISDVTEGERIGSNLDGFKRLAYLGLCSTLLSRLAYAVSHTDHRLVALLRGVNQRIGQEYALRGYSVANEADPSRCIKYVVTSPSDAPWNIVISIAAAASPLDQCTGAPGDNTSTEKFKYELPAQAAVNKLVTGSAVATASEFLLASESIKRLHIEFIAAMALSAILERARALLVEVEMVIRKRIVFEWMKECRTPCKFAGICCETTWKLSAADILEENLCEESNKRLQRVSFRRFDWSRAVRVLVGLSANHFSRQRYASWLEFLSARKQSRSFRPAYLETAEWCEWCGQRASEMLFLLPSALQQMGIVEEAAPMGASITLTGHSWGGAVASIVAVKMNATLPVERKLRVRKLYTTGAPNFLAAERRTMFDDIGIDYVAFGHRHDPALTLPRSCVPASPGFFECSSGTAECVAYCAVSGLMAHLPTECWRYHAIDCYAMSFLDATAETVRCSIASSHLVGRKPKEAGPWPLASVLPTLDETIAVFENVVYQGLTVLDPYRTATNSVFTPTMMSCITEVFRTLSFGGRVTVDAILSACSAIQPLPPLYLIQKRLVAHFGGVCKPIKFPGFVSWITKEFSRDPSFVKRFLKVLRWEVEAFELVLNPASPMPQLTRFSINEQVPLMCDKQFSAVARSALSHTFSHYSRVFPASPFDSRSTGVPVATFACCCVMLSHMRWPSIGTCGIQFVEYAFTAIEKDHIADPYRALMVHSGDCTEAGFLSFMHLIVQHFGEEFFLERMWTLGYNELFQHSITRGTMCNIHARGCSLCQCLSEDGERLRQRQEDESQFRRWVVNFITTTQQEKLDRANEESLKKVNSIRCAPITALPKRTKSLHQWAPPMSVSKLEMQMEEEEEDPLEKIYAPSPSPARMFSPSTRAAGDSLHDVPPQPARPRGISMVLSPEQLASPTVNTSNRRKSSISPSKLRRSSSQRKSSLRVNQPTMVTAIYSNGALQLLNDFQRRALGAQLVSEERPADDERRNSLTF